jgi:hypothetical protein
MPAVVLAASPVYCGECSLTFEAAVLTPPERPPPRRLELDQGQVQCARHARNPAVAACERCGAFMCALCKIDTDGKALCAACFERLRGAGELESATTTFRSWRTLGLHLGLVGIPMMSLGILIGPASIFATVRGMSQDRKDGSAGGKWSAVGTLILGSLVTLVGILTALSFAAAFRRS